MPSWILRWGNILILVIMVLLLAGSYFISYPETVSTSLKLVYAKNLPQTNNLVGVVKLSPTEIEKVKKGQKVLIHFPIYPENEYGIIEGVVNIINLVPDKKSLYQVEVLFPNGNRTDRGKKLHFVQGMEAQATILTKNIRLIERFIKL